MGDHVTCSSPFPEVLCGPGCGLHQGKAAIHIARTFMGRREELYGHHFWLGGMMSQPLVGMRR